MRLNSSAFWLFNTTLLISVSVLSLPTTAGEVNPSFLKNEELEDTGIDMQQVCRLNAAAFEQLPPEAAAMFKDYCGAFDSEDVPATLNEEDAFGLISGGSNSQAFEYYQQALLNAGKAGNRVQERQILSSMALSYENQYQYVKALEFYEQALMVAKQLNDKAVEAQTLSSIGRLYARRGQYAKGITYLQQSVTLPGKTDPNLTVNSLNLMGLLHQHQGEIDQASQFYEQALSLAKSGVLNKDTEVLALRQIGRFYQSQGQYDQALALYEQILSLAKQDKRLGGYLTLVSLKSLGDLAEAKGDYAQALDYYQQATKLANTDELNLYFSSSLVDIGRIYNRLGRYAEAEEILIEGINTGEEKQDLLSDGLQDLSEEDLEDLSSILPNNFVTTVDQYSPLLYESERNGYQELQRSLIAQNKTNIALEISERAKARAFSELVATRLALSGQPVPQSNLETITLEQIQRIAQQQNATLVQYSILKKPSQEGILEFGLEIPNPQAKNDLQLLIWVIKPSGEITFRQVDLPNINYSVETFVQNSRNALLRSLSNPRGEQLLSQLHQLLIDPIADQLPSDPNAHVIFIPDGTLFLVPFAALKDSQGKYLIEKHTIRTTPAIRILDLVHQQRQSVKGEGALIVGNPIMPDYVPELGAKPEQLSNLPNAALEAEAIATLFNTQAITGKNATKKSIVQQMPNARIIHFATHGLLDSYEGLGSAIALSPSEGDDGFLTAQELVQMKLNAELVVLSACDTGRGLITGDGVIGLSRSLIGAGVPSVLVSVWAVPDASTAFLMTQFYQEWQNTPDKAQALRQAMLTTMKQYPSPRDWAAFTLVGEAL